MNTILIVEDNADDVLFIKRAFKKANIINPIRVVEDGEKAIAYLDGKHDFADRGANPLPFLILLDLKLPRFNGFEVLEHARGLPVVKRIPVVVLTSSVDERDVKRAYDLGANSYLVKPVDFDSLLDLARRLQLYWFLTNRGAEPGPT